MNPIARAERAGQAYEDRLLNEYLSEGEYRECPECGDETLETVDEGSNRRGWWIEQVCRNEECDYEFDDAEPYDDYYY